MVLRLLIHTPISTTITANIATKTIQLERIGSAAGGTTGGVFVGRGVLVAALCWACVAEGRMSVGVGVFVGRESRKMLGRQGSQP